MSKFISLTSIHDDVEIICNIDNISYFYEENQRTCIAFIGDDTDFFYVKENVGGILRKLCS